MQAATQQKTKPRRVTWRRVLMACGLVALACVTAVVYFAAHLEAPAVRNRVKRTVYEQFHVDLDYQKASVGISGFELHDLVIASPRPDRDLAPELLRIKHIALTWHLGDFLPQRQRRARVTVTDVGLNVVLDTHGVTSLQRFLALLPPSPDKPSTPLSQLFRALKEAPAIAIDAAIHDVHVRLTERLPGGGDRHAYLGELALTAGAATGPQPTLDAKLDGSHFQAELAGFTLDQRFKELLALAPWLQPLATGTGVLPLGLNARAQLANDALKLTTDLHAGTQPLFGLEVALTPDLQKRGLKIGLKRLELLGWTKTQADFFVNDAMTFVDGSFAAQADLNDVQRGDVRVRGAQLTASATGLHLALDPSATTIDKLDAQLLVKGATLPQVQIGELSVAAHAHLNAGVALAGDVSVTLDHAHVHDLAGEATLTQLAADLTVVLLPDGVTLTVKGSVAELAVQTADGARSVKMVQVQPYLVLQLAGLARLLADPLAALRWLTVQVNVAQTELRVEQQFVRLGGLQLGAEVPPVLREAANIFRIPQKLSFHATVGSAALPGGVWIDEESPGARVSTQDLRVLLDEPLASTGQVRVTVGRPLDLSMEATKTTDAVNWALTMDPDVSAIVAAVPLPASLHKLLDWKRLLVSVSSEGKAQGLTGLPHVTQTTNLHVANLTLPGRASVRTLDAKLTSDGAGLRQTANFTLDGDIERVGPVRPGGQLHVSGKLDHDPEARHLLLNLAATGPHGLDAQLDLQGHAQGADLAYTVTAAAQNVAAFLHGLPEVDRGALCLLNPKLGVTLDGKGALTGGAQLFAQKPPTTADGQHTLALNVTAVGCKLPQGAAQLSRLVVNVDASLRNGAGKADVTVAIPDLEAAASGHALRLDGLKQHLTVELRVDGTLRLAADGKLARLTQDAMPALPLGDLTWLLRGWSGEEGARVEQFELTNPPTGTRLTLTGGYDRAATQPTRVTDADVNGAAAVNLADANATETNEPVPGRLGLNLKGELRQDVGALVHDNPDLRARGVVTVPFRVESGDLLVYHTDARVHFDHVDVGLTKVDLQVTDIFGDMPLMETFTLAPQFQILGGGEDDAYARWRFSEHQPFLRRTDFLSIGQIRYAGAEFGPIAGNAGVDRDVFRMDQLEATLLHGQLTGQCMVLLNGEDTHVQLRGNATGLQVEGSEERLDANAALDFLPARRALDGRAEILHMGRKHLESLLNLWDPYAEDAQSNRLRTLLKLGYPKHVKMRFLHGFLDVGVELGGLGGLVQIDELRGIALGPVFQRWLDPLLEPLRALRVREAPKP